MTEPTRLDRLRARMRETGTDLVALAPGAHMDWLLGYHPHPDERPCLLCVTPERAAWLMPALNAEGTREHTDLPFYPWADADGPSGALDALIADLGVSVARRIALDETMRADHAFLVTGALPQASHTFSEETVGALRMRKDAAEIAAQKENALIADRAMEAALAAIRPGVTEIEVAAAARAHFAAEGARPLFNIVGAGPNGAFPHHQSGDRPLAEGDAVVIDIGARKGLYSSDITRMAAVGHAPEGYQEVHDVVERAVQAALAAARPGVAAKEVDLAARGVIADAGYGDYFVHRTGHGLGVEGHEPPYLSSTSETILEEGMVFSIEPGIYIPGRFGIRLEDIVVLRADGPEILSERPRDLTVV